MRCYCQNCAWSGESDTTNPIKDIHARVLPGEFMPAGECPVCGSLVDVPDEEIPGYTIQLALGIATARGMVETTVRDQFAMRAPAEPAPWFSPAMPPFPGDGTPNDQDAWIAELSRRRSIQWPYAWADAVLSNRGK